jgi:hypothetical protein
VKAAQEPPTLVLAEGVLELVAIAPGLYGRHDLLELEALQPPDPTKRLIDLLALDLELVLIGEHLPGNSGMVGHGLDALGSRHEHLERARVGVAALALVHDGPHTVAGYRTGDEHDVAALAQAGDPLPAVGERVDLQLEHVAALRPASGRGRVRIDAVARQERLDGGAVLGHWAVGQL